MKSKISILIIVILAFSSCLRDNIVWDSENVDYRSWKLAAPIAKIHIPLYETMKKELDFDDLFVNEKGVICIRYTQTENIEWDNEKIGIRGYEKNWMIPYVAHSGSVNTNTSFKMPLMTYQYDSYVKIAELSTGKINFTLITVPGGLSGNIIITIPKLTKDGKAFTETISLSSVGTLNYPIAGYMLETDDNHDLEVEFSINASGTTSGIVNIHFEVTKMDVSYLSGYFGKVEYNEEYEINFDFFDEFNFNGTFGFREIKMDTKATNRAGLPMEVKADLFFTDEIGLNKKLNLSPPFKFDMSGAAKTGDNVTPSVNTFSTMLPEIEFENGKYPTKLKFEFNGTTNPNGNPDTDVNFIVKNNNESLANVDFTLTVPLYIKVEEFSRMDIMDFDYNDIISDYEDFSTSVKSMSINLAIANNLPFEITLAATAIDDFGKHVEQILHPTHVTKGTQNISIPIIQYQLEKFKSEDVKNIIFHTTAKTANGGYVEVKEDFFLDIDVSMRFEAEILNLF